MSLIPLLVLAGIAGAVIGVAACLAYLLHLDNMDVDQ